MNNDIFEIRDILEQIIKGRLSSYQQYIIRFTNKLIYSIVKMIADKRYDSYSVNKSREILIAGDYYNYMIRGCRLVSLNLAYKSGDNDMIRYISNIYDERDGGIEEKEILIAYKYGNVERIDYLESINDSWYYYKNSVDYVDNRGKDIIYYACCSGSLELVKRAVLHAENPQLIHAYYAYSACFRYKFIDIIAYFEAIFARYHDEHYDIEEIVSFKLEGIVQSGDYAYFKDRKHEEDFKRYEFSDCKHLIKHGIGISGSIDMYRDLMAIANEDEISYLSYVGNFTIDFMCILYENNCVNFIEHYVMHRDSYILMDEYEALMKSAVKSGNIELVKRAYAETNRIEYQRVLDYDQLILDIMYKGYEDIALWLAEKKQLHDLSYTKWDIE